MLPENAAAVQGFEAFDYITGLTRMVLVQKGDHSSTSFGVQLATLPEYAAAACVKVNPDTPQKRVRYLTLTGGSDVPLRGWLELTAG
jgi:hypothetical protein